ELGSDPFTPGAGVPFRRRVARSLARGRTWVGFDGDEIVFKADIAAMSPQVAQIQGGWVRPGRRSRRIGTGRRAAVGAAVQSLGLTPSLVVNESTTPGVRAYRGVGMTPVVPYATVLTYCPLDSGRRLGWGHDRHHPSAARPRRAHTDPDRP